MLNKVYSEKFSQRKKKKRKVYQAFWIWPGQTLSDNLILLLVYKYLCKQNIGWLHEVNQ